MLDTDQNPFFEAAIFEATGRQASVRQIRFVSGGCIHNSVQVKTDIGDFFIKANESFPEDMFEQEAKGLRLLAEPGTLRVPEVLGYGMVGEKRYLLLEYVGPSYPRRDYWHALGEGLAQIHALSADRYGLDSDNYMGALRQSNDLYEDWTAFFVERRLKVQFSLAYYNKLIPEDYLRRAETFYEKLQGFFPNERPALVHGDLWSGNVIVDPKGRPVLIDPAAHYGHREVDLAMTRLFGGFESAFYESYESAFPLEPGFEERKDVYNLYPLLVHVNLFGDSYLPGVEKVLRRFE